MLKLLLECVILEWGIPVGNLRDITNLRFCPTTVCYVMLFAICAKVSNETEHKVI